MTIDSFIAANREDILSRCRAKVRTRGRHVPVETDSDYGIPLLLEQLVDALHPGAAPHPGLDHTAVGGGHDPSLLGFTASQVAHTVCQAITEAAVEMRAPISIASFHTLARYIQLRDGSLATLLPDSSPQPTACLVAD